MSDLDRDRERIAARLDAAAELERRMLSESSSRPLGEHEFEAADAHLRALIAGTTKIRQPSRPRRLVAWVAAAVVVAGITWAVWPRTAAPERPSYLSGLAPGGLVVSGAKPELTLRWTASRPGARFVVRVHDAAAPNAAPLAESPTLTDTTWTPPREAQLSFPWIVLWRVEARLGSELATSELVWPR